MSVMSGETVVKDVRLFPRGLNLSADGVALSAASHLTGVQV